MTPDLFEIARECGFDKAAALARGGDTLLVCLRHVPYFEMDDCESEISPYYFASQEGYRAAGALIARIEGLGYRASAAPEKVRLKPLAQQCGLGFIGLNTLCISREYGSDFFIAAFVTDMPCGERICPAYTSTVCAHCGLCARLCPAGALDGKGGFARERCLRQHMGREVPEELRALMGRRLLGCTACQDVCPFNAKRTAGQRPRQIREITALAPLLAYQEGDPWKQQRQRLAGANYMRPQRLCGQALLVAANTGRIDLLPQIGKLKAHENPAVAAHALWAEKKLQEI